MSDWEPYLKGRLIKKHEKGFYVIKPEDSENPIPIACPICETLMSTSDDEVAFLKHQCCHACDLKWAASRSEAWKNGWRPSQEDVQDAVKNRPPLQFIFNH